MIVEVGGRPVHVGPRAAWDAAKVEVAAQSRPLRLWLGLLTVLCLIGAVGAVLAIAPGWEVFGTTPTVEWGLLIIAYVFFAVTTSGLCLASSLGTVFGMEMFTPLEKRHAVLAVLSLVTAFGIIALDLHFPLRLMFGMVLSPSPTSPMWWMGVLYGIYLCFLLTEVWSMFTGRYQVHQVACVLASIMAILAPTTLGAVFGVLVARSYWFGAFTPPSMLVAALMSGTALLGIVFYCVVRFQLRGHQRAAALAIPAIRLLMTIVILVSVFLTVVQVIGGLYGNVPGVADATLSYLVGPLALPFWILRVILGLLVPLALLLLPRTRTPAGVFAASCLAFMGLFVDRVVFVLAGQIAPTTASSGVVSDPWATYVPSFVEVSITVGGIAFIALAYTLAERFLDMGEHGGHVGFFRLKAPTYHAAGDEH